MDRTLKYIRIGLILAFSLACVECFVEPVMLVHGGAENIPEHRIKARLEGVKRAAAEGYRVLKQRGRVLDAVEEAVRCMEEDSSFNAGHGSSLNLDGEVEMDASIMVGSNLSTGTVSVVKNIVHPVSLARLVMEESPHYGLAGEGARRFARDHKVPLIQVPLAPWAKDDLDEVIKYHNRTSVEMRGGGGVGAIAIDSRGRTAAACSSGGSVGKLPGRMSHASIIGASIYADDTVGATAAMGFDDCAVRYGLAHQIINNMKRGFNSALATRTAVKELTERFHRPSGAITISRNGQIGISFTSHKMAWGYQMRDEVHYGIDDYEDFREKISLT